MILRINQLEVLTFLRVAMSTYKNHPVPLRTRRAIEENAYVNVYCILLYWYTVSKTELPGESWVVEALSNGRPLVKRQIQGRTACVHK